MASSPKPAVKIRPASFPTDKAIVSRLFLAYAESLPISLAFQNFTHELASLPGKYAVQKSSALYLAYTEAPKSDAIPAPEQVVSCVCLRAFAPPQSCELKRLYLAPEARRLGVGALLLDVVVARARDLGYEEMLLDTLSSMAAVRRLYAGYGFEEVGAYYESVPGAVFYRLDLRELGYRWMAGLMGEMWYCSMLRGTSDFSFVPTSVGLRVQCLCSRQGT